MSFTSAFAGGFSVGISAAQTEIEADGKETEGTETINKSVSADAVIGSVFAEFSFDNNFTVGAEWIPVEADISDQVHARAEQETSRTGTQSTTNSRLQTADAEIDNHVTYYAEIPIGDSFYVKGGYMEADVLTKETTDGANGGTYGDTTIDGYMYGIGIRKYYSDNMFMKLEGTISDYDDINLTSTTSNKISADIDATAVALRLGYTF
tara:strand:- start:54 stop:677 length:624 start_codon:yes stop_codon:yes gene_type:complete